jgi:hypothetical protein
MKTMKYLVIQCTPLGDQWECDAHRLPICMTDDPSQYGYGYEVWRVQDDGTFVCVKEYETSNESGMALYYWHEDAKDGEAPKVLTKFPNMTRWEVSPRVVSTVIQMAGFADADAEEILEEIRSCGSYGEECGSQWMVFGEYEDSQFTLGY